MAEHPDVLSTLLNEFGDEQQKVFIRNFQLYTKLGDSNDFVIPVDAEVVRLVGYARKDRVITVMRQALLENRDYKVVERTPANGGRSTRGYVLTPNGFKHLCMVADTANGKTVREYYCAMMPFMMKMIRERTQTRPTS